MLNLLLFLRSGCLRSCWAHNLCEVLDPQDCHLERPRASSQCVLDVINLEPVRGAVLTKGPDFSFAEAHKGFDSEQIHMEDEVKDQEDEVEDGRDK